MADKPKPKQKRKTSTEDRMSEPGVFIVGDKVIHDGEAELYDDEPMIFVPEPERTEKDED